MARLIMDSHTGVCWECTLKNQGTTETENPCTRTFRLVRALVSIRGRHIPIDAWKCPECGMLVPLDSMNRYQKTKELVISQPRRERN